MRKHLILLLLLTITKTVALAQDSTALYSVDKYSALIKFHPLAAINTDRPSIIGSLELQIKNKIGIELGYGRRYIDNTLFDDFPKDSVVVKPSGATSFIELTLYNPLGDKGVSILNEIFIDSYLGIAYRYFNDAYNTQKYYWPISKQTTGSMQSLRDCYGVKRNVSIFVLRGGAIFRLGAFSIETYGALGIRHKRQVLVGNEFDPKNDSFVNGLWFSERPYNGYLPTINVGLKVNYKIWSVR